ncbi:MAG: type II toxin-antitoxin system HicB family antitoxin [Ignavibacteria bacterium]|nr:type II toxin-antitoxin system HicB family antitoxin [Ignavibacteria bacterium]
MGVEYLVVFEKTKTGYSAYVPDLPGCAAAGKTKAETEKLIKEAIEFHIEGMILQGEKIPVPSTMKSGFFKFRSAVKFASKNKQLRKRAIA